jgi:hypothetical protein
VPHAQNGDGVARAGIQIKPTAASTRSCFLPLHYIALPSAFVRLQRCSVSRSQTLKPVILGSCRTLAQLSCSPSSFPYEIYQQYRLRTNTKYARTLKLEHLRILRLELATRQQTRASRTLDLHWSVVYILSQQQRASQAIRYCARSISLQLRL